MMTFDDLLGAVRNLPPDERVRLIGELIESVPPEEWPTPSEQWIAETQRRSAEYDAGRMSASSWPEVRQRARRKADLDG